MAKKKTTKAKAPETEIVRICNEYHLSVPQRKGIVAILESAPGTSQKEIAEEAGITYKTYWTWMKQKPFLDALAEGANIMVDGQWTAILKAGIECAKGGDIQWAKWLGQVTGRQQDTKYIDSTIKQEITGELSFGGLEPEELRTAVGIIRQLKTKRYRDAVNN